MRVVVGATTLVLTLTLMALASRLIQAERLAASVKDRMDAFEAEQEIIAQRYECILMDEEQSVEWLDWCDEMARQGVNFKALTADQARRLFEG